jgi:hypothetical protein
MVELKALQEDKDHSQQHQVFPSAILHDGSPPLIPTSKQTLSVSTPVLVAWFCPLNLS